VLACPMSFQRLVEWDVAPTRGARRKQSRIVDVSIVRLPFWIGMRLIWEALPLVGHGWTLSCPSIRLRSKRRVLESRENSATFVRRNVILEFVTVIRLVGRLKLERPGLLRIAVALKLAAVKCLAGWRTTLLAVLGLNG
jgi:hypothetical protein